ncbi:MAG: hypothetical protein ACR2IK_03925 [Chloroflexota bacterium]
MPSTAGFRRDGLVDTGLRDNIGNERLERSVVWIVEHGATARYPFRGTAGER